MSISQLIEYFYYNVSIKEYDIKSDEYQNVFAEEGTSKKEFLKALRAYVPDKGFQYTKDRLKNNYSFRRTYKELEKFYIDSDYAKEINFQNCIGMIFYYIQSAISFSKRKNLYTAEGERLAMEVLNKPAFRSMFSESFLNQKPNRAITRAPEHDTIHFEIMILAHFAANLLDDENATIKYKEFLDQYKDTDSRNDNFPFSSEIEKEIIRNEQHLNNSNEKEEQKYNEALANAIEQAVTIPRGNVSNKNIYGLREEYLKTGKNLSDFNQVVAVSKEIFDNNPDLNNNPGVVSDHYVVDVLDSEIWYQNHKSDENENMLDRFINRANISNDLEIIKEQLSEQYFNETFSLEEYGVCYIRELALSLFKLFNLDLNELTEMVKTDPDCKASYNYLKKTDDNTVLRIYHSSYEEYVSNLFGSLLLNLHKKNLKRFMYQQLDEAEIYYPNCFDNEFSEIKRANGGLPETERGVQLAAGSYLISFLKSPAATLGVTDFLNYFIQRYCACVADVEMIPDEALEGSIMPVIKDFEQKRRADNTPPAEARKKLFDTYAIYEAVTQSYGLNKRYLSPETPLSAFKDSEGLDFLLSFTYFYFNKYIGTKKTLETYSFADYFQVYSKALIYKNLIDHILDDEGLIPPDFDLSFEKEYQELIQQEDHIEEKEQDPSDVDSLLKKIEELKASKDRWKQETQSLHTEKNRIKKDYDRLKTASSETEEENDRLKEENDELLKVSYKYDELMAEKLKGKPQEIEDLLSSRKIAISGGNKATIQRLLNKYHNWIWYEKASDVTTSAGQMDYVLIMTQFNAHKISESIKKQVGNSATKVLLIGEIRSNFELTEKVMYYKIKEEEGK